MDAYIVKTKRARNSDTAQGEPVSGAGGSNGSVEGPNPGVEGPNQARDAQQEEHYLEYAVHGSESVREIRKGVG